MADHNRRAINSPDTLNPPDSEKGQAGGGHGKHGLTVFMTAVFMVGEMAGSGVLALPAAVESCGWIGLVLIAVCGFICSYTGEVLSECWTIVQDRFPRMRGPVRYPYPAIGMLTFGRVGRVLISFSIDFTMLGSAVVFVILAAQNMHSVVQENSGHQIAFCYWIIIVLVVMWPLTMPGTPKDFKYIGIGAMTATSTAIIILLVLMGLDVKNNPDIMHTKVSPLGFASAFGTMLYAFGGHAMFPTFQTDMREPAKFGKSCRTAYLILVLMYLPVAGAGFFVYGDKVQANVLLTVTPQIGLQVVQCLITLHLVCSFIICVNPICQEFEELLGIEHHFNYKRALLRTGVCVFVLGLAETVPHFGAVLSLVGGSSITLTAFICPPVFFFKLVTTEGPWDPIHVPLHKKVALGEIMVVGILAGVFSTYSAIRDLATPDAFTLPCFINVTAASG